MNLKTFMDRTGAAFVTSRTNPKTALYASLAQKKSRDEAGLFLAEGIKLASDALDAGVPLYELCVTESALDDEEVVRLGLLSAERNIAVTVFGDSAFVKISTEKAPQGVIAVLPHLHDLHTGSDFDEWQRGRRLLMLCEVRDPGNLGTILRSAEALGRDGVILSGCADLYNPKTVRAAMGTLFRLPVYLTDDPSECISAMKSVGRRVLAAALGEESLTLGRYETKEEDCPVIGNEGHGLSGEILALCTACVKIPMAGDTESLNASAAAACILWEYCR